MRDQRGADWNAALAEVRVGVAKMHADRPFPSIDKSFVNAPAGWRRSEEDEAEMVPLWMLQDLLRDLESLGPRQSQANIDGWYEGLDQGLLEGLRSLEQLVTGDRAVIEWREHVIADLRVLRRRVARRERGLFAP